MGYIEQKEINQYFRDHLEEIFSKKEVKKREAELLAKLNCLLLKFSDIGNDKLVAVCIVDSYRISKELIKNNPKLQATYQDEYHEIYVHARCHASRSFLDGDIQSQIRKELKDYHEKYVQQFSNRILKEHYNHLVKIAFLREKIERLGILNKKWKSLSVENANLLKEMENEKALIY